MLDGWRELCGRHGVRLGEIGRRIGKSKQYMSELAKGNIRLTYEMAMDIANALGTTPDDLFLPMMSNQDGQMDATGTDGDK